MKRLIVGLLLCGGLAFGQTFWGVCANAQPQTSPKPTGCAFSGVEISTTQQIYSFSETDITLVGQKLQTSVRTGGAIFLRKFGSAEVLTLIDGGVATTGVATTGAGAVGGMLIGPAGKHFPNFLVGIGVRYLKTGASSQTLVSVVLMHRPSK